MATKLAIGLLLLIIIASLASAFYFVMRDEAGSTRSVKALSWRIGLSIAAFAFLLLAGWMGWIEPNNVQY